MTGRRLSFLILCAASLAGCLRRETAVSAGNRDGILHVGIGQDVQDLDPQLASQATDYRVLSSLLEGLVSEDPVDLHPVPGVAAHWDVSPDQTTYTFYLRPDARWSNGEPVTARDFISSWRRILSASLGSETASQLFIIEGAEAFNRGQADFSEVGLAAPDNHTLRVTLEHPATYFLSMMNSSAWLPVPISTIEQYGSSSKRGNPWARAGRFVGNGPFVLAGWHMGQEIAVNKSPTYWDRAQVRLNGIRFHPIDSIDAEERAFRSGQLHVTEGPVPPSKIDAYRHRNPSVLRIDPLLGTYFYRINVRRPGLNDPRVRRALALAVDRTAIIDGLLKGGQLSATSFVPPDSREPVPEQNQAQNAEEARRLLADSGHAEGRDLPEFELLYNTSESHGPIAEALEEGWRKELGVHVQLVNQDLKGTLDARRTGSFDLLRSSWVADYVDPSAFLEIWRSDSANNFTGWSDPQYDSLLVAAERTSDPAARAQLYAKAERILQEQAPVIPIYHYTHVFLIQPSVHGWNPTALDHHPFKGVWLGP